MRLVKLHFIAKHSACFKPGSCFCQNRLPRARPPSLHLEHYLLILILYIIYNTYFSYNFISLVLIFEVTCTNLLIENEYQEKHQRQQIPVCRCSKQKRTVERQVLCLSTLTVTRCELFRVSCLSQENNKWWNNGSKVVQT